MKQVFLLFAIFTLSSLVSFSQSFDKIGIEHNNALDKILPHLKNTKKEEVINRVKEELIKVYPKESKLINSLFIKISLDSFNNPESFLDETKGDMSTALYDIIVKSMRATKNMNSSDDVLEFVKQEKNNKRNLSDKDEEAYMSFLSILKHSTLFWTENGSKRINWWKVGIIDAIGGAAGAYVGGLGGAVVGGAASSAISVVSQW